jgi:hypothetical protein
VTNIFGRYGQSPQPGGALLTDHAIGGGVFGVSSLSQGLRQSLRLSFLSADHNWVSRGNRLIEGSHLSQNITPLAGGMMVRDEEAMASSSVLSPLPQVSERHSPSSIILPLSKQEIKLPFLNPVLMKKEKSYTLQLAGTAASHNQSKYFPENDTFAPFRHGPPPTPLVGAAGHSEGFFIDE